MLQIQDVVPVCGHSLEFVRADTPVHGVIALLAHLGGRNHVEDDGGIGGRDLCNLPSAMAALMVSRNQLTFVDMPLASVLTTYADMIVVAE